MKFTHRLGYYFGGLAIGLIFLAFFLRKKSDATGTSFCYFPNCRVLKELRAHPLEYSDEVRSNLEEYNMDTTSITLFLQEGAVNFSKSETRTEPCKTFIINHDLSNYDYELEVKLCDSLVIAERMRKMN